MEKSKRRRGKPKGFAGPYTRQPITLARLDGRRREAYLLRQVRQMLTEHVGGKPNVVQRMLIDRAAVLSLRLALADERIIDDNLVEYDSKALVAWQNALTRTLTALGVQPDAAPALPAASSLYAVMREVEGATV